MLCAEMSECCQISDGDYKYERACIAAITLGVLVGILLILLGVVTTGLAWTCRKLRKVKKSVKNNSRYKCMSDLYNNGKGGMILTQEPDHKDF